MPSTAIATPPTRILLQTVVAADSAPDMLPLLNAMYECDERGNESRSATEAITYACVPSCRGVVAGDGEAPYPAGLSTGAIAATEPAIDSCHVRLTGVE